jgi:hypothetical protein
LFYLSSQCFSISGIGIRQRDGHRVMAYGSMKKNSSKPMPYFLQPLSVFCRSQGHCSVLSPTIEAQAIKQIILNHIAVTRPWSNM